MKIGVSRRDFVGGAMSGLGIWALPLGAAADAYVRANTEIGRAHV